MPKAIDITGEKYSRLTVIKEAEPSFDSRGYKKKRYHCKCDCGNTKVILQSSLRSGVTTSCGCVQKEKVSKHNLSKHPLYYVWTDMNKRCNNPNNRAYKWYGAKGITVCPEWHKDNPNGCKNFIDDMYPSYLKALKIINKPKLDKDIKMPGNKVYSKDTCAWVSSSKNNQHQTTTKLNEDLVKYIRSQYSSGRTLEDLAQELNVSYQNISCVVNCKTWADVA